jgi:hypothetical protein
VKAGFTPGPWQAFTDRHGQSYCIDTDLGRASTNVTVIADDIRGEQRHANARLIAAAPELFEALEVARGEIAKVHQLRSALPQIDAALAKARGEG